MKSRMHFIMVCAVAAGILAGCGPTVTSIVDPAGNSGTLTIPVGSFTANSQGGCFLANQGWDKYYPITGKFCGPNVGGCTGCFTNTNNLATLVVKTCDPANGTNVRTGIVVVNDMLPTDKVCATNAPSCQYGTNLTINVRQMASGKKYRANVFYKSATLGGLTNVTVKWSYE